MAWVLLLSWATHFIASPTWRTPITTDELLRTVDAQVPANWSTRGPESEIVVSSNGAIRIEREGGKRRWISQTVALSSKTRLLRFQAELHTETPPLDRFTLSLRQPLVLSLSLPEGERRYPLSVRPIFLQSSLGLDEVIELDRSQDSITLSFVKPAHASWEISNIRLSEVVQHPQYSQSQFVLAGLWLATLFVGIYRAWRRAPIPTLMVVGVLTGVLAAVLASKDWVDKLFTLLRKSMNVLGRDLSSGLFSSMTQSGHIILFAVLTLVVLLFRKNWNLLYTEVIVAVGVLAIATEALQRHALGRSPDILDFVLDIFGIFVALILFFVLRGIFKIFQRLLSEPS